MTTIRETRASWPLLGGMLFLALSLAARADEAPKSVAKPSTGKIEVGTIKVEVTLKGVVEAQQMTEVSLTPEAWTMPLTVERAVEHGTSVKQGDIMVELETEKIDQAIKDLRVEQALADLALKHADDELPVLEKLLPLDLASAERLKVRADEDLARFLEIDRPLSKLGAEFQLKSAVHQLEYAKDELAQLEKMYRAKDLTEETEQMILKRHRFQVESAQFYLKTTESTSDHTLKVDLPRREQTARDDAAKNTLALERARHLLPLEIQQKRMARDKLRFEKDKNDEKLAKLEKDRKTMTVRAPADGIVYYGKAARGQWTSSAGVAQKLQKGGVLTPSEVFITIVSPRPAFVRATVEEKDLHTLRSKMEGKAAPAGYPDLKLPAKVAWVSPVPQTPGNFEARVDVDLSQGAEAVVPGMSCTVKFVSYRKDNALTAPAAAVFSDDEEVYYVYLPSSNGKPHKQTVKRGKTADGKTEILDGLKEGDEILATKP